MNPRVIVVQSNSHEAQLYSIHLRIPEELTFKERIYSGIPRVFGAHPQTRKTDSGSDMYKCGTPNEPRGFGNSFRHQGWGDADGLEGDFEFEVVLETDVVQAL
jgi:hypothetical protein